MPDETSNRATWVNMASKLSAMGGVAKAGVGEPTSGVQSGMVAVIAESGRVDETTLSQPREIHTVTLRRYEARVKDAAPDVAEYRLDAWRAQIMSDLYGDFDLGGTVAYLLPVETTWEWGYQTVENTTYRLLDIHVSYRIDGRATFVA